jgi:hypothetical protein
VELDVTVVSELAELDGLIGLPCEDAVSLDKCWDSLDELKLI